MAKKIALDLQSFFNEGLSANEISKRTGINVEVVRRRIRDERPNYKPKSTVNDMPFGMDRDSLSLRLRLGDYLFLLKHEKGLGAAEVRMLVGLTSKEQTRASARPFDHDWTISQQQRLAKALDISFKELVNGK